MPNHASATIVGHIGREPESRVSQNGKEVLSFSVATSAGYGDEKKTTWWNVVLFGKQAEVGAKHLSKGDPVMITGEPSLEEWKDRDGNTRTTLKLTGRELVFLKGKDEGERQPAPAAKPVKKATEDAPFDDDLPF
jgi:single-strand DNA-binding protein